MTWEEIIVSIRKQPEYKDLVEKAYFDEDLELNVQRFKSSLEFLETKKIIAEFPPAFSKKKILDIGSGNGISAVAFALEGNVVTAVEPDKSQTIGSGAILLLKNKFHLSDLFILDSFGESLPLENESFDVVYIRQAMHHAHDLNKFVAEAARVLKKGGLLLTIRDHVVFDEKDKQWFLETHPLHQFYGGENAFTYMQYSNAITNAGFEIKKVLKHFDSVINYFPMLAKDLQSMKHNREKLLKESLERKLPSFLADNAVVKKIYEKFVEAKLGPALDERKIPGRMYSFIAIKK